MATVEERGRDKARGVALRLALTYGAIAALWVLFSDRVLAMFGLPMEVERFLGSVKGAAFVLVTAAGLYFFTQRRLRELYSSEERHTRLFEHSTEGLMVFRVRDLDAREIDLVIEDVNPIQTVRLHRAKGHLVGQRMSDTTDPRLQRYFDLVKRACETHQAQHEELRMEVDDVDEVLTAFAIEDDLFVMTSMDVSDLRAAQKAIRNQEEWIRDAYVDVLSAVTGGKLVLLTERELDAELGEPLLALSPIECTDQLAAARAEIKQAVGSVHPGAADSMELLNPLGEALNNVLKHAGSGQYGAFSKGDRIQLYVGDDGPGIDFRTLPKAALVAGFSTTATLGLGFTIMLQLCDRVLISTRPGRTIVVLEVSAARVSTEMSLLQHTLV